MWKMFVHNAASAKELGIFNSKTDERIVLFRYQKDQSLLDADIETCQEEIAKREVSVPSKVKSRKNKVYAENEEEIQ